MEDAKNSQTMTLLQANVSYASYLQDKNNTDNTSMNTDNISDNALFPQITGETVPIFL